MRCRHCCREAGTKKIHCRHELRNEKSPPQISATSADATFERNTSLTTATTCPPPRYVGAAAFVSNLHRCAFCPGPPRRSSC
uniref:Uncharacterized protein n=1 Tax=Triticum urartu TaxID=4572 RepID=A0A8R7UMY7_TRIUA